MKKTDEILNNLNSDPRRPERIGIKKVWFQWWELVKLMKKLGGNFQKIWGERAMCKQEQLEAACSGA